MSRKRKQSKRPTAPAPVQTEAVPEEILAEGSGPVERVDASELAEAAKAVGRRGKKRRAPVQGRDASTESAPSDQSDEVSADEDGTSNGADGEAAGGEAAGGEAEEAGDSADAAGDSGKARPRRRRRRGRAGGDDASHGAGVEAAGDSAATAEAVAEGELRADGDDGVETVDDAEGDAAAASDVDDAEMDAAVEADGAVFAEPDTESAELEAAGDEDEALAGDELRAADGEAADGELAAGAADGEAADGEALGDEDVGELGAVLPTSAASMDAVQLKHLVEALVFASDKPLTVARLRQLTRVSDTKRLEQALADITEDFRERGIVLQQVSGGYQFRTRTQFSSWVQQLIAGRPVRLSRAQLETLAIIAYRQPITRPEIDDIRGVDSTATLKLLIDRALIRTLGKKEEVGRPMLYGTTKEFLDFFSLGDLRELPTLREYSELTDESRKVMSARLGIDLDDTPRASSDGGDDDGGGGGDDDGGGGGSGGGGGDSGGSESGGFDPDSFDPDHAPGVNGVDLDASADTSDIAADSEPMFDEPHDASAEQAAPDASDDVQAASDASDASEVSDASDASDASDDVQAASEDVEAAAASEPEAEPHVGAAEGEDAGAPVEAAMEAEAESHVGAAEPEDGEIPVGAAQEATSESHVGAAEVEDAGMQVEASSAWDEAASHVGPSSEVDMQVDARDTLDTEAVVDSAVMEGLEWPEGSGRVGEVSEAGLGSAIAFAPAPVEVTATDDVDVARVADPALVAEQRTTQSALDPTPE